MDYVVYGEQCGAQTGMWIGLAFGREGAAIGAVAGGLIGGVAERRRARRRANGSPTNESQNNMPPLITTYVVDDHTIEFGPDFPPNAKARVAWSRVLHAFVLERFIYQAIWIAADWERVRAWPISIDESFEQTLIVDDSEIRLAKAQPLDAAAVDMLISSAGFQWDGMLLLSGSASAVIAEQSARDWFDSIGSEKSLIRPPCDAIYPVADAFGLRYSNSLRSIEELRVDVESVIASAAELPRRVAGGSDEPMLQSGHTVSEAYCLPCSMSYRLERSVSVI